MSKFETQIEKISEWIEKTKFEDIPLHVIEIAKFQTLDIISAICAGYRSPMGQKVYLKLKKQNIKGEVMILPTGEFWTVQNAAYYHAAMINALEMDNFSFLGHLSQSSIGAAWSLSFKNNLSGKDFLLSSIIAQEVSGRLGAYLSSGPLQGHMRSFIHRIAAAVVVTKIHGCPAPIIANAIAISLSGPEFYMIPSSFSADTKVTSTSSPTVEGINSGYLAMEGATGPLDLLEHPAGFVAMFSYLNYVPDFWKRIGTTWVMESISFKYYASCAYAQGPVNAAMTIRNQLSEWNTEKIKNIKVKSPILSLVMENFSMPHYNSGLNQVNINFSTKKSLALAILFGEPNGDFFSEQDQDQRYREIEALTQKISLHHDWKLSIDMIMGFDKSINNPGYPGVFGMSDSQKALKRTQKVYQNRSLFEWGDLIQFLSLPKGYLRYLGIRYLNSFSGKYFKKDKKSHEMDLSKMEFHIGSEITITFNDGSQIKSHCGIPKGFAGDPGKIEAVLEKYERETVPILGKQKSDSLREIIMHMEKMNLRDSMVKIIEIR
ncbi:MmgE/PrpD family protein [Aquiflexum sp. TKW24L]|uniref:MmgE/PrpD family protein n=1 Tax=Aquiflexum sp. TKW24L TaxID=2942212 RepID=UPI0020BF90F7|nr:MmgE/PrpD family protein [Aquiflexum sp. TKW24L]MCL6260574.1 MmgE/PrpD family protein [Aquiflexum sp. TKW24L]